MISVNYERIVDKVRRADGMPIVVFINRERSISASQDVAMILSRMHTMRRTADLVGVYRHPVPIGWIEADLHHMGVVER